ncbi:MAG TPA: HEAT repeat domain-containing protein, partial [Anaerolineales bacterium]|nr:HEAT repeat domain-containing protein [Anaerolineales bacterium]
MDVSSILTNVVAPIIIVGLPLLAFCYIAYDVIRKIRRKAFIAAFDAAHEAKNTERLIEYLQDWETAERAGKTLEEIGQPAVEPLIAALQSPTPLISNGAAYLLGRIKDQRALEPLSQILRSSNETKIS